MRFDDLPDWYFVGPSFALMGLAFLGLTVWASLGLWHWRREAQREDAQR